MLTRRYQATVPKNCKQDVFKEQFFNSGRYLKHKTRSNAKTHTLKVCMGSNHEKPLIHWPIIKHSLIFSCRGTIICSVLKLLDVLQAKEQIRPISVLWSSPHIDKGGDRGIGRIHVVMKIGGVDGLQRPSAKINGTLPFTAYSYNFIIQLQLSSSPTLAGDDHV